MQMSCKDSAEVFFVLHELGLAVRRPATLTGAVFQGP